MKGTHVAVAVGVEVLDGVGEAVGVNVAVVVGVAVFVGVDVLVMVLVGVFVGVTAGWHGMPRIESILTKVRRYRSRSTGCFHPDPR